MGTELSDKFFGGTSQVRIKLANALKEAREKKGVPQEDVDTNCMLKYSGSVKCSEYEANPQCITPLTFSLASSYLGIFLARVLHKDLSSLDIKYIVNHMNKAGAYVVLREGDKIITEETAPVYFYLKIMEELEQECQEHAKVS